MPTRGLGKRLVVTAAAFAFGVGLTSVFWAVVKDHPNAPEEINSVEAQPVSRHIEEVQDLEARLRTSEEKTAELTLRSDALTALANGDWPGFVVAVNSLEQDDNSMPLSEYVAPSSARLIYLAGLKASRTGRYSDAATLLSAAGELAPTDAYFHDDAVYYEARALDRLGRHEFAMAAYKRLMSETPGSSYADDASRFLGEMQANTSEGETTP